MGYIVRMPQMGMEMDQGEVVSWEHDEGGTVEEDGVLVVVESEKATNEVEAREEGTLRRILVSEGGTVEPGTPIGIVAGADEDISALEAEIDSEPPSAEDGGATGGDTTAEAAVTTTETAESGGAGETTSAVARADSGDSASADRDGADSTGDRNVSEVRATPGARQLAEKEGIDVTAVDGTGPQGVVTEDDVRNHAIQAERGPSEDRPAVDVHEPIQEAPPDGVRASPGARKLASAEGVDVAAIDGTGPEGVVIEDDVARRVAEAAGEATATTGTATEAPGGGTATRTTATVRELSRMQQTVSDRLSESYRNAVHVTNKRRFDASTLQNVVAAADAAGLDVSMTDLLVKAVGAELAARPEFNALFEDGEHKLIAEVNVGVAVDVEEGLVTPVVPRVTDRSVEEVARVRGDLTDRTLSGEFTSEDLAGGTFTISNLGPFGVDSFDPVINPPEVAILGVGRIREDDTMTLSLSFDHRVVNGADAARFLGGLVETLTDPLALAAFFEADVLSDPAVDVSLTVDRDA